MLYFWFVFAEAYILVLDAICFIFVYHLGAIGSTDGLKANMGSTKTHPSII